MRGQPLPIRSILWLTISALTVIIALLVGREMYVEWHQLKKIESLKDATAFSDRLFDATDKLSVERDVAFAMLHSPDHQDIDDLHARLTESRRDTDAAFSDTAAFIGQYPFPELSDLWKSIETKMAGIRTLRGEIDQAMALPKAQRQNEMAERWYGTVTELTTQAQDLWAAFIRHFTDINPIVTQHLRYKHFMLTISDYTSRERALIGKLLVENADATPEETGQLLRWQGMIALSWKMSQVLADQSGLYAQVGPAFKDAESHYQTMYDMVRDIFYIQGGGHGAAYPISTDLWFELSTQSADSLNTLKEVSKDAKHTYLDRLVNEGKQAITLHLAILIFALGTCAYCFFVISRRVINPINAMIKALLDATEGKPVSFVAPADRQDEIGKLAHVLYAFQKNAEEIKHTAIMLENYTHALERSNKELDDFAYIASHDLKEPLRGIHNHSRFLLEDNEGKLDPDSVSKLNRLVALSQRMEHLISDLLYFSRLGRQEMAFQSTDLNEVIRDIENTLDVFLTEHHAHISVPEPLPTITCDKVRISEVFRNLVTNGVKYNDKPEKMVEIGFLENHAFSDGNLLKNVFYVRDDGRGIPPEFHEEIFRIFRRLQSSTNQPEDGTGVGLTFVKKIIERHGGRIWLESQPGAGSTFYFTLVGEVYDTATGA